MKNKPVVGILLDTRGDPPYISVGKLWKQSINILQEKYSIEVLGTTDIVIKGIGFISIKNGTKVSLNIDPKYIEVRKSIFGGIYENTSNER